MKVKRMFSRTMCCVMLAVCLVISSITAFVSPKNTFANSTIDSIGSSAAPFVMSTFEQSTEGWVPGVNVATVNRVSKFANGPKKPINGSYCLDASFLPGINANEWRSVQKTFNQPIDLTYRPYIVMNVDSWGTAWLGGKENYVRIKVYSGDQVKDSGEILYKPDQWNPVSIDMTGWAYRNRIDKIEILYRASLDYVGPKWDPAHFQIDQLMATDDPSMSTFPDPGYKVGYSFEQNESDVALDGSGNGLDAVSMRGGMAAPAAFVPGITGNSLSLQGGKDEYLFIHNFTTNVFDTEQSAPAMEDNYTISAWVKPNGGSSQHLFQLDSDNGASLDLKVDDQDRLQYTIAGGTAANSTNVSVTNSTYGSVVDSVYGTPLKRNIWQHVALTVAGDTATLYVNGQEIGHNDQFLLRPGVLGEYATGRIGAAYSGMIDEFRIFNRTLSVQDLQTMSDYNVWYTFNDAIGSVARDALGFHKDATLMGGASFAPGLKEKALQLNGTDAYLKIPEGITDALGDRYSITAGVRLDARGAGGDRLFNFASAGGGSMLLRLNAEEGGVKFTIQGNGVEQDIAASTASIPLNEWSFVSVVVSGGTGILYVNGQEVGRNDHLTLLPSDIGYTTDNTIGKSANSGFMKGRVDEFRIYNHALSPQDVSEASRLFLIPDRSQQIPITNANWTATDALGRKLPTFEDVGPTREDKYVGMFYYIWQGAHGNKVYDITQILKGDPKNLKWGPNTAFHWWGQPEAGYYRADDPWVIRRNMQMLSDAGVDFIYFDVSNGFTYLDTVKQIAEISLKMRSEGIKTPYIAFLTHGHGGRVITDLYNNLYKPGLYKDLWFIWDGKPLILGDKNDPTLSSETKDFFTFRYSWAWTDTKNTPDQWQWLDEYPQDYGWHSNPLYPEQMTVAAASHPTNNRGQSYSDGVQPTYDEKTKLTAVTGQGRHLAEQWDRALQVDPDLVMVTQWNEWLAQRFIYNSSNLNTQFLGKKGTIGGSYFIDVFNEEYNRDIEPMKDGHTDNNYYELMSYVRKYKGMEPPAPEQAEAKIGIDGKFDDWKDVQPTFHDPAGDTMHRDWASYDPTVMLTNETGRNDIIESQVAYQGANLYFHVKTKDPLTPYTDPNWMELYIDTDQSKDTGWEGYDYAVNLHVLSDNKTTLSHYEDGKWVEKGTLNYRYSGNQLEVEIPRLAIGQNGEGQSVSLQFHWADNIQKLGDISEFFLNGDSAPDRRANFQYGAETAPKAGKMGWTFDQDTEGWQAGAGTTRFGWQQGGYIGGEVSAKGASIVSPDQMGIELANRTLLTIKLKNGSTSTQAKIYFTTDASPDFSESKAITVTTVPNSDETTYSLDMSQLPDWGGKLKQLKIVPISETNTGSFRIDSVTMQFNREAQGK